ncbi:MAG: hypothetical protein RR945_02305 [Erysipelotrichaceae bacterium]
MPKLEIELIDSCIDLLFSEMPQGPLNDMQRVIINEIATNDELMARLLECLNI